MAVPPSYSDLGKAAKDIFSKGYGFGVVKLDLKTKSQSGVMVRLTSETDRSAPPPTVSGRAPSSMTLCPVPSFALTVFFIFSFDFFFFFFLVSEYII
ncbi:hypothetical protein ILYODFUR_018004 [Ilyodon furcidens]|uniref:Voltage-dependent anion-selective channel protein 3 n=1 Tax=Ilyodon furcidens TaxID=33524 RepID=A0ABV0T904_9TELE